MPGDTCPLCCLHDHGGDTCNHTHSPKLGAARAQRKEKKEERDRFLAALARFSGLTFTLHSSATDHPVVLDLSFSFRLTWFSIPHICQPLC